MEEDRLFACGEQMIMTISLNAHKRRQWRGFQALGDHDHDQLHNVVNGWCGHGIGSQRPPDVLADMPP
jgi:hypothetical protein